MVLALTALVVGGCGWIDDGDGDEAAPTTTTTAPAPPGLSQLPEVVADVSPSVVVVRAGPGEGSGVVWGGDGRIVTNDHVVATGGGSVTVVLADGSELPAEVVATDPYTDLALLQVDRTGLPVLDLADAVPEIGTPVVAIGNPLGFENTVSMGVISGARRSIPGAAGISPALVDLVQTDAAISPGNSGGALVDLDGRLVGITVAYLPPQATGAVSIGFAIPVPTVADVVDELVTRGRAVHAFAGFQLGPVTPRLARAYGLPEDGVIIGQVVAGAPADEAGLSAGDVIVGVEGEEVDGPESVLAAIRRAEPGDPLLLEVLPGGDEPAEAVRLDLAERPPPGGRPDDGGSP